MKISVFTLGCKVNECESDSLISGLIRLGHTVTDKLEYADLYIINTCAVTNEAEKKSRQTYSRVIKLNRDAKIIFCGCATQNNPDVFLDKPNVLSVYGTFSKSKILQDLEKTGKCIYSEPTCFEEMETVKSLRTRAYVKVQDGCNNFCSYCLIPYLRGRTRSRDPLSIINEINSIHPVETVINGINLSAYNYQGIALCGLIKELKDVDTRIRLGSLEVGVIDDEFLTALSGLKDFAPHFHLSLQSGSDSVLKKMNRHYTTSEFLDKVNLIRKYFPDAGITTDIIVGFPSETDDNFKETLNFVDAVEFSDIHPFAFSKRNGTVASKMPDLNGEVKTARLNKLMQKKLDRKYSFASSMVGKILSVLLEESKDGYYEGYSENYLRVYIKDESNIGQYKNKIVKVKIITPNTNGAIGEIIK